MFDVGQARRSLVTTASASGAETRSTMFPSGRFPLFSVLTPHLSLLRIPFWSLNSQPCRGDPKGFLYYQSTKFMSVLGIRSHVLQKRSMALCPNGRLSPVSCRETRQASVYKYKQHSVSVSLKGLCQHFSWHFAKRGNK
jgi:hypothetical protein